MSALSGDSDTLRGPPPRVLLVDDHPELLRAMRRFLATSCDIVGEATSGDAAFGLLNIARPIMKTLRGEAPTNILC